MFIQVFMFKIFFFVLKMIIIFHRKSELTQFFVKYLFHLMLFIIKVINFTTVLIVQKEYYYIL